MFILKKNNRLTPIKYVLTGVATWIIDNGLFALLNWQFGDHIITGHLTTTMLFTALGMITGFIFSFVTNRKWTFESHGKVPRQVVLCILLLLFNTIVTALIVDFSVSFGFEVLVKCLMSAIVGIWNYFAYKYFIYKK